MTLATAAIEAGVAFWPASPRIVLVTLSRSFARKIHRTYLNLMQSKGRQSMLRIITTALLAAIIASSSAQASGPGGLESSRSIRRPVFVARRT
jgi:hypothetical protein